MIERLERAIERVPVSSVGIGVRAPHVAEILRSRPALGLMELLADNHLAPGGPARWQAQRIADRYPVALHAVGLSLGSRGRIDKSYARALRNLAHETEARWISDHLSFSYWRGRWYPDLLPLPLTEASLERVATRVLEAQDVLGRTLLVENPSRYLPLEPGELSEGIFLCELVERTGCGVLLDLNNACVNQFNLGSNALELVERVPPESIGCVHVAGYTCSADCRIDTHGAAVSDEVWQLLARLARRRRYVPVVVERDRNLGTLDDLLDEASAAGEVLARESIRAA